MKQNPLNMMPNNVTEQLKKDNPYEWIGRMNNIQACVREVVGTELIYT